MEIKMKSMLIPLILLVLLASCGTDPAVETAATQTFDAALQTAVAATVQAEIIAAETNAFAPEATQQPTELPETTVAPVPTFTEAAPTTVPTVAQVQPTADTSEPATPCYRAEMISETIPDLTVFKPGEVFVKIWVIRNTGVCEWTEKFTWKLVEGEDFGVEIELPLNRSVQPGEDLEVKLEMQTPLLEGNYKGTYQILTEDGGSVTPLGFWVYIISRK